MHSDVYARKVGANETPKVQIQIVFDDPDEALTTLRRAVTQAEQRLMQAGRPARDTRTY